MDEKNPPGRPRADIDPRTPLQHWIARQLKLGSSYSSIAEELGVHRATIQRWAHGVTGPATAHLSRLMRVTGLSVTQIARAA